MANSFEEVLDSFGVALTPTGTPFCADLRKAHSHKIHHSFLPVAVVSFSMIAPDYARDRFPGHRLSEVVLKRPSMDMVTATAFARSCGETITGRLNPEEFVEHLLSIVDRYREYPLFRRVPDVPAMWGIDVRPLGVYWETDWATNEAELHSWRSAYCSLKMEDQILIATILWLYSGEIENFWLANLPNDWPAVDAICLIEAAGLLKAWSKLVASYPGW